MIATDTRDAALPWTVEHERAALLAVLAEWEQDRDAVDYMQGASRAILALRDAVVAALTPDATDGPGCPHIHEIGVLRSRIEALRAETDVMTAKAEHMARVNDRLRTAAPSLAPAPPEGRDAP